MKSDFTTDALISARCPYCVVGHEFRPMQLLDDGVFVCPCGHTAKPRVRDFRCSCDNCARAAQQAALLADAPDSSTRAGNLRQMEIQHSLNLLTLEESVHNSDNDNPELSSSEAEDKNHEVEIKKQLLALYEQQKAFAHPTPGEQPSDYEPEELESWAMLQARIDALEAELAKMPAESGH